MSIQYSNCALCARKCGVNRHNSVGFCLMPDKIYLSRASLHMWEEPSISGSRGSGTVFLSGCSLGCIYCQNRAISRGVSGTEISVDRLSDIMLELQRSGAHNINFVTPTHYAPSIREAIELARERGLSLPTVYNTGSYDIPETIGMLNGYVDIYLADFKYYTAKTAKALSGAPDYPEVAKAAIAEMFRQTGEPIYTPDGIMQRGTIVRILLLPGKVAEAKLSLKYLYETYGDKICISLMSQYTPMPDMPSPLDRRVTNDEYRQLCDYADRLGITNGFTQERSAAMDVFIPDFDGTGIIQNGDNTERG